LPRTRAIGSASAGTALNNRAFSALA
jgi:hypothetical protein